LQQNTCLSHSLTSLRNKTAIKVKNASRAETIAAIVPTDNSDFEDDADVDVGLGVEVKVGLEVVVTPKPGIANVTSTLHQLPSTKLSMNSPLEEVEYDA